MESSQSALNRLCCHFPTPERTLAAASNLSRSWCGGDGSSGLEIQLTGDLGTGKTVFVKGLALGMGLDPAAVSSPTFVLANQYQCPQQRALHHVDFYRLESFEELESMGFFDLGGDNSILAVEWGDRFPNALSRDRLEIALERDARQGPEARSCEVRATGPVSLVHLHTWQAMLTAEGHLDEDEPAVD